MDPLAGLGRRWLNGIFEARERAVKYHARALEDRPLSIEAMARAITNYDKRLRERFGQAGERECDKRMQRPFHTLTATPGQIELVTLATTSMKLVSSSRSTIRKNGPSIFVSTNDRAPLSGPLRHLRGPAPPLRKPVDAHTQGRRTHASWAGRRDSTRKQRSSSGLGPCPQEQTHLHPADP